MKRDNLFWRALQPAAVHWNDNGEPSSDSFGDIYYSSDNGLAESRHVFLQGNDLPQRWLAHTRAHFCIGELGFGTGLNFLMTLKAWLELPAPRPDLHYLAIEKYPLTLTDLTRALQAWPSLATLAEPLLASYPGLLAGQHRLLLEQGRVRLDLWWEDAGEALPDLAGRGTPCVDAWYLDGFAPSCNAGMWNDQVLAAVAALSMPQATLATFTVAGQVRRALTAAGFKLAKVPGYGRKRECLRGVHEVTGTHTCRAQHAPWDIPANPLARPDSAMVIGAGLAGCTAAAALARRGIAVTVLEQGTVASAGSGNDQGILYTRLSRKHSSLVDFALQGFWFAASFYRQLLDTGALTRGLDGELCGNFQQTDKTDEMTLLVAALNGLEQLARVVTANEANTLLGIEQRSAGYWFPRSGWLRPSAVCRALLHSDRITLIEHCGSVSLQTDGEQWHAHTNNGLLARAHNVILATGTDTPSMAMCSWLPMQRIRGQVTQLPSQSAFADLRATLCHEGYIAPARNGLHTIGATFDLNSDDPAPRAADNRANLDALATAIPTWRSALELINPDTLQARVAFRCASPDYLPLVGPVPDRSAFIEDFGFLRNNAKHPLTECGRYLPGLYLSAGHGSRGLTSTPIAAELLASMICGEPPPLSRSLCRALSPARFLVRDLLRNRL